MDDLRRRFPDAVETGFGDTPALSAHLLGLIAAGAKTATCSALRDYGDTPVPRAGQVYLALDHRGAPALAYRVDRVDLCPFDEVPDAFALAEGEGDVAGWRAAHIDYFHRNGGFDPKMMLVCERFTLLATADDPPAPSDNTAHDDQMAGGADV